MKKIRASAEAKRHAEKMVAILNGNRLDSDDAMDRRLALDADETVMLALQLEQMRARVYEAPYKPLQTLTIAPMASDVDGDAETFAWEEIDQAGEASFIDDAGLGDDLKSVEVKSTKQSRPIYTAGSSFSYTFADIRRAARAGKPLQTRKVDAARRAFDRLVDRVVSLGDTSRGITYGMANWAMGTGNSQVRNTAATTAAWATGTVVPQTMLDNLNLLVKEFKVDCASSFAPDTLVLSPHHFILVNQAMFTDGRPESVAERFLRLNPSVKRILELNTLVNVGGASNTTRAILCESSPDNFEAVVPTPFQLRPPQEVGLGFKILGIGRVAGFVIYQPLAMRYLSALPNS